MMIEIHTCKRCFTIIHIDECASSSSMCILGLCLTCGSFRVDIVPLTVRIKVDD